VCSSDLNYIREKDNETGWYSYSWSLNHDRMERWASTQVIKLNSMAAEGGADYYFCPACGSSSISNFESAATVDFRCERCNRLLEFLDEKRMAELFEKAKG
jgi:transcription initiation factor IIE alpha subunit